MLYKAYSQYNQYSYIFSAKSDKEAIKLCKKRFKNKFKIYYLKYINTKNKVLVSLELMYDDKSSFFDKFLKWLNG